jgi:hypothetical protein
MANLIGRIVAWWRQPSECSSTRHEWNVTAERARASYFLRADCQRCGKSIDAASLVRIADRSNADWLKRSLLRGFPDA